MSAIEGPAVPGLATLPKCRRCVLMAYPLAAQGAYWGGVVIAKAIHRHFVERLKA